MGTKPGDELVELSRRRARLAAEIGRIKGQEDAARTRLREIRQQCRDRKLDPDNLEAVISRLDEALGNGISDLRDRLDQAEEALGAFL